MITNLIIRGAKVHNLHCIQPSKPADRLYKSQAADGACFLALYYFRIHLRYLLGAFSSGNSIISLDTPFPPASAQSGTVPPP